MIEYPEFIIVTLLLGAFFSLLLYRVHLPSFLAAMASSAISAGLVVSMWVADDVPSAVWEVELLEGTFLGFGVGWFQYLFLLSISFIAPLVVLFSYHPIKKESMKVPFYGLMLLSLTGALGVVMAKDLLALFLSFELMTWSSLLLIGDRRPGSSSAFKTYLVFGMLSAVSILSMVALLSSRGSALDYGSIAKTLSGAPDGFVIAFMIAATVGFGSKAALFPFHVWAPKAYSHTTESFASFFSGGLSKAGIFGIFLTFDVLVGVTVLASFGDYKGLTIFGLILALVGAITALVGGVQAMLQDDARKLLAYSSVSQLGYIMVGIGMGGSTGTAGALYHVMNHTVFKALLFMGLGAIVYRTGETRLSRLGGMIHVMPASFFMFLVGIFAAAAIPITTGLASKWLIYESALERGLGILVPILFVASVAAFLYSFRILQGGWMGQLRDEFKGIREAPLTMLLPMAVLTALLVGFAFVPGLPMELISKAMADIGIATPEYSTTELFSGVGSYNGLVVMLTVIGGFVLAAVLFFSRPLGRKVDLRDTFTAGEEPIPDMDKRYHYAWKFYAPYERELRPYFKDHVQTFYDRAFRTVSNLSRLTRSVYNGDMTAYIWSVFIAMVVAGLLLWRYGGWF